MVSGLGGGRYAIDGRGEWRLAHGGADTWIGHGGRSWAVRPVDADAARDAHADGELRAPMPGAVLLVPAQAGQTVSTGDPVVVLESMKMELAINAPLDGVVAEINVSVGDRVVLDQPLARVEASA